MTVGSSGRWPTVWQKTAPTTLSGARCHQLAGKAASDAVTDEQELLDAEVVHQTELTPTEIPNRMQMSDYIH